MWGVLPPVTIQPAMSKVSYDPIKDFAPVSVVGTNPFVLVVNKDVPAKSVKEFVAWVKSQPQKMSYAEGAVGSVTHLAMALFLKRAGIEMTNVSYRGNNPALTDVVAGHIPTMFSNVSDALPQIQSGAIRALAVSSEEPVPQLPGVPTVAASFPGYSAITWNGLMAPAGTPKPIIDKMAAVIAKACKDPAFVAKLATPRRRSARQHAGAVRRPDRQGLEDLGRGRRGRRPEDEIAVRLISVDQDMHSPSQQPILIAGGGPVGVITALALARQGLPVHVFEAETKSTRCRVRRPPTPRRWKCWRASAWSMRSSSAAWSSRCSESGTGRACRSWPSSISASSRTRRPIRSPCNASSTSSPRWRSSG